MDRDRRTLVVGGALAFGGLLFKRPAEASVPLEADDGSPIRSAPAPDLSGLAALPSLLRVGAGEPDLLLVEAFDYNCGHCRAASRGLGEIARSDERIGVAFLHLPILSEASMRAASVVAATLSALGSAEALAVHEALLESPGRADEAAALEAARRIGLNVAPIADRSAAGRADVLAQLAFGRARSLRYPPTFVLADRAFIGWPGVPTMQRFIASARRCGALICGDGNRR